MRVWHAENHEVLSLGVKLDTSEVLLCQKRDMSMTFTNADSGMNSWVLQAPTCVWQVCLRTNFWDPGAHEHCLGVLWSAPRAPTSYTPFPIHGMQPLVLVAVRIRDPDENKWGRWAGLQYSGEFAIADIGFDGVIPAHRKCDGIVLLKGSRPSSAMRGGCMNCGGVAASTGGGDGHRWGAVAGVAWRCGGVAASTALLQEALRRLIALEVRFSTCNLSRSRFLAARTSARCWTSRCFSSFSFILVSRFASFSASFLRASASRAVFWASTSSHAYV